MDVYLLTLVAAAIVGLIVICTAFLQVRGRVVPDAAAVQAGRLRPLRRVAVGRDLRRRMRDFGTHRPEEYDNPLDRRNNNDDDDNDADDKANLPDHKIGAKRRAKLAAKAEKKVQRLAAERDKMERLRREQHLKEERDRQAEEEQAQQLRAEQVEKKAREEKERQEHEEYLKIKEAFSVEEEGYEQENGDDDEENLLQQFLAYIKMNKVLLLEDLAAHFGLKTASVVERIQQLQANGSLTGVIDDRGKFIYISEHELEAVAKFLRQRGRVSITELAENSNNLINLAPAESFSVSAS